jgi:hypothetical protein
MDEAPRVGDCFGALDLNLARLDLMDVRHSWRV